MAITRSSLLLRRVLPRCRSLAGPLLSIPRRPPSAPLSRRHHRGGRCACEGRLHALPAALVEQVVCCRARLNQVRPPAGCGGDLQRLLRVQRQRHAVVCRWAAAAALCLIL